MSPNSVTNQGLSIQNMSPWGGAGISNFNRNSNNVWTAPNRVVLVETISELVLPSPFIF